MIKHQWWVGSLNGGFVYSLPNTEMEMHCLLADANAITSNGCYWLEYAIPA